MTKQSLLTSVPLGPYQLPNRVVLAPMTRNRAGTGNVPTDSMATYYRQRASGGLLITEATQISPQGVGYPGTPGIHSEAQVDGWKKVTEAVHAEGGRIFLQLWHVGRISHPDLQPDGQLPVAPSAVRPQGQVFTGTGMKDYVTPRALETSEIQPIVEDFRQGAANALAAGFDGVEIHGANGYLIQQFLGDDTNQRTDEYGGSVENRARMLLEITQAVVDVWGSNRVGVRLSPGSTFNDMHDSDPKGLFTYVINELNRFHLAYLHLVGPQDGSGIQPEIGEPVIPYFGKLYQGTLIANGGFTRETGNEIIEKGEAHLVSYGQLFLANPDLPVRFEAHAPLNQTDRATFYGGTEKGYTDYPFLAEIEKIKA